jgi:hypothetical protein
MLIRFKKEIDEFCRKTHVNLGCFQAVDIAINGDQSFVSVWMRADTDGTSLREFAAIVKKFEKVTDVHVYLQRSDVIVPINETLYDMEDLVYTNQNDDKLFNVIVYFS